MLTSNRTGRVSVSRGGDFCGGRNAQHDLKELASSRRSKTEEMNMDLCSYDEVPREDGGQSTDGGETWSHIVGAVSFRKILLFKMVREGLTKIHGRTPRRHYSTLSERSLLLGWGERVVVIEVALGLWPPRHPRTANASPTLTRQAGLRAGAPRHELATCGRVLFRKPCRRPMTVVTSLPLIEVPPPLSIPPADPP